MNLLSFFVNIPAEIRVQTQASPILGVLGTETHTHFTNISQAQFNQSLKYLPLSGRLILMMLCSNPYDSLKKPHTVSELFHSLRISEPLWNFFSVYRDVLAGLLEILLKTQGKHNYYLRSLCLSF